MKATVALLLLLVVGPSMADEAKEETRAKVAFVADVTMFEGMFYSVLDYCAPYAGQAVANLTKADWLNQNSKLLKSRDVVHNELIGEFAADKETADQMRAWREGIFSKAREEDRAYSDILGSANMVLACSKRLGEMVSDSMTFRRIAPKSFAYWSQEAQR
jgi:hypothetical protein